MLASRRSGRDEIDGFRLMFLGAWPGTGLAFGCQAPICSSILFYTFQWNS